jgi:hypothetical protein
MTFAYLTIVRVINYSDVKYIVFVPDSDCLNLISITDRLLRLLLDRIVLLFELAYLHLLQSLAASIDSFIRFHSGSLVTVRLRSAVLDRAGNHSLPL